MCAVDTTTPLGIAPTQGVQAGASPVQPTIDSTHRDIALARSYSTEIIKLLPPISGGILALHARNVSG